MLRTILGLGVAMILAGLYFVYAGIDYIVLERGWTMVIAGTTLGSAGAILVGLWAVGRELRALREVNAFRAPTPIEPALPRDPEASARPAPELPVVPVIAPVGAGLASAASAEAVSETLVDDAAGTDAPDDDGDVLRRPVPADGMIAPTAARLDASPASDAAAADDGADHREPVVADLSPGLMPASTAEPAREFTLDAVPGPIVEPPVSTRVHEDAAPSLDIRPTRDVPSEADAPLLKLDEELSVSDLLRAPEAASVAEEEPAPPAAEPLPEPEPAPEVPPFDVPTVVGSYASGGHTYVMFSDGSIEAETPEGVFKFGSLDELKAFIASGEARPEPVI